MLGGLTTPQYDAVVQRYVIRGGREGYERLKVLARLRWDDTSALLNRVGVRSGWRCLDVGCGSGDVTLEIARMLGERGSVVGIDIDTTKLELARKEAAESGLQNVEFRVVDVNDWSEPLGYDLVFSRFLLQHLSQPLDLIRRMWAAVRSGGALVVEDTDFEGLHCEPPNAGFEFYAQAYPSTVARFGGDANIGRKLYGLFLEADIPNPNVKLVQRADAIGGEKPMPLLTLEATAQAMIDGGLATAESIQSAIASLAAFTDDPTTIMSSPRIYQVWSHRP